jgi:hypothetical protein
MKIIKEKFASQAASDVLAAMRQIADDEGRQFQALLDEAMRDFIEKRNGTKPRAHVLNSLQDSIGDFNDLYTKLAE